jgi:hypothetical protein
MRQHVKKSIRILLWVSVAAALCGGCAVVSTVTDAITEAVNGVTKVTSSTTSDNKSAEFVETRFASIRSEAARGEGEHLDSLATLLGETDRADFARFMKERYSDLFVGLQQPSELLPRISRYRGQQVSTPKDA